MNGNNQPPAPDKTPGTETCPQADLHNHSNATSLAPTSSQSSLPQSFMTVFDAVFPPTPSDMIAAPLRESVTVTLGHHYDTADDPLIITGDLDLPMMRRPPAGGKGASRGKNPSKIAAPTPPQLHIPLDIAHRLASPFARRTSELAALHIMEINAALRNSGKRDSNANKRRHHIELSRRYACKEKVYARKKLENEVRARNLELLDGKTRSAREFHLIDSAPIDPAAIWNDATAKFLCSRFN